MDPNIMKLLEEDEDETMHSGADVDAFTAELNRDIEGLAQGSSQISVHFLPQWQTSSHDGTDGLQSGKDPMGTEEKEKHSSEMEIQQYGSEPERKNDEEPTNERNPLPHNSSVQSGTGLQVNQNAFHVSQPSDTQAHGGQPIQPQQSNLGAEYHKHEEQNSHDNQFTGMVLKKTEPLSMESSSVHSLPMGIGSQNTVASSVNQHSMATGMSSQQPTTSGMANQQPMTRSNQQSGGTVKLNKQVPFGMLLPIIQPQLDKDRAMQLHTLYFKLKKNEISKDGFVKHMRSIVGDQMLKMAVFKLTQVSKNSEAIPSPSARQLQATSGNLATSLGQVDRKHPTLSSQGINQQPTMHGSQTTFPTYATAGSSYPPYHLGPSNQGMNMVSVPNKLQAGGPTHLNSNASLQGDQVQWASSTNQGQKVGALSSLSHVKPELFDHPNEQHKTQFSSPHGLSSGPVKPGNVGPGKSRDESLDMQPFRSGLNSPSGLLPTNSASSSTPNQTETNILSNRQMPSLTSPIGSGNLAKTTPPKKPITGQKKPMETPGSSPPSKKQKVVGGLLDQSIEHLNDVTAVSGVDLREEEEQLFSGPKEDSRVSEASRQAVQEEEQRLILHKVPLQKKVVEIMAKYGLKNMGNDVERCLSLVVEERLHGLIFNLIRLSKQRLDIEKPRHKCIITSDVRQQILSINNKARQEWEKKQAETEKSQNLDEANPPEDTNGGDGDKEKDETRAKLTTKANKEDDDKMRATAANVAVRAATGVGDMLSRWQLMIEAKQKQGGSDASSSSSQPGKDSSSRKPSLTSTSKTREGQESEKPDSSAALTIPASTRKVGKNKVVVPRVARSISVKDVIAVLEREPQMSKSTLIYRLFERI